MNSDLLMKARIYILGLVTGGQSKYLLQILA